MTIQYGWGVALGDTWRECPDCGCTDERDPDAGQCCPWGDMEHTDCGLPVHFWICPCICHVHEREHSEDE